MIYDGSRIEKVEKINPYLLAGEVIFIENRRKPLIDVPEMFRGSQPTDGGNLILIAEEKEELLKKEPQAELFIRPFLMGADFIKRKPRYCIWLVDANPTLLRKCPLILERVRKVREFRLASKKLATQKKRRHLCYSMKLKRAKQIILLSQWFHQRQEDIYQ